jgi:trk system potassium uptake protein TrkH
MSRFSLNYLGIFFILISILSFFNIINSYYFNLYLNIDTYIYTSLVSTLIGVPFLIIKKIDKKITIYEKILIVIIGYIFLPLIISIPYYLSIYNISFLDCYFEAISGFTSTGFTIFENIKHLDESLILWRSTSQWIGGIYFLFSIVLLIDIFDNNLKKSLTNFISFNTSETFKQSFKISILYGALTLILFIVLNLINIRTFDAFNLSMTIIASGGFLPVNNIDSIINSNFKEVVFSILMLISFFSLFLSYNLVLLKNKSMNFFIEDFYLFIYFIFLVVIFFIFFNFNYNFSSIFFSLTSSISNIGISLEDTPDNLAFIFLILVIIGGSFFSTSSGIRFMKLYSLIKFSINELLSHSKPKHVYINKFYFSDTYVNQSELYKYFLSVLVFIVSLFTISSLLTISNINIEEAFKLGILTLMNTVNSSMFDLNNINFFNLNIVTKLILIFFMIIGRIELLTVLIISKKFLFKN